MVSARWMRNVNERTRLSLYADFLYPLASDSTLEDFYREKPEGEFCPELMAARTRVWEVRNVPKGSGLGTSSILSAACVKAVFEFMGIAYTEEDLYGQYNHQGHHK